MPIAVIVDWYGPFSTLAAFRREMANWEMGTKTLYMAYRADRRCNYIGLTSTPSTRFVRHPKVEHKSNRLYFAGEITSQGKSGRRSKKTRPDLDICEHALISRLQPKLNQNRKVLPPEDCVVVYSRFFDPVETEIAVNPLPDFPPVIAYNAWAAKWDV